jgi:hypothetical protein
VKNTNLLLLSRLVVGFFFKDTIIFSNYQIFF